MLTTLEPIIDAYPSKCDFFLCNYGFQTLNIILCLSMWIAHASIHVCYCSSVTSSHSRETMSYSMSSWHHHTILAPSPHGGGSITKMISLDDEKELIHKVLTNFQWKTYFRHLFYACLILKSFNMLFSYNKY